MASSLSKFVPSLNVRYLQNDLAVANYLKIYQNYLSVVPYIKVSSDSNALGGKV